MRTPIGALASALELWAIDAPPDAAARAELLQLMARQVDRLTTLADGLHQLARDLKEGS